MKKMDFWNIVGIFLALLFSSVSLCIMVTHKLTDKVFCNKKIPDP
jgi:hypothetical protein